MICPKCSAEIGHVNRKGEPMLRGRGLVLKTRSVAMVCPKCAADVPVTGEFAKALQARLFLVFKSDAAGT